MNVPPDNQQRQAEPSVIDRRQFLDILETLPVMVCLLTPDRHIRYANRAFRQRFGEPEGRHCYEYCCGTDEPCPFCESFVPLKTGRPHHWEFASPDGSTIIDAYVFPFSDLDGSPLILEMDIDVSEKKMVEAELARYRNHLEELIKEKTVELSFANARLRKEIDEHERETKALVESEEKYRVLFQNELYAICIFDADTLRFLDVNDATVKLYGYSREELLGGMIGPDISAEQQESSRSVRTIADTGMPTYIPIRFHKKKDRTVFPVEIIGGLYTWRGKKTVFGMARDISERYRLQEELHQREHELSLNNQKLEKLNIALEVVIEQKSRQLETFQEDSIKQFDLLVKPYIKDLKAICDDKVQIQYVSLIERGIEQIFTPFARQMLSLSRKCSPMELKVIRLIADGSTIDEIARELNISQHTVKFHRKNIRSKLGLRNRKINLRSYLSQFDNIT